MSSLALLPLTLLMGCDAVPPTAAQGSPAPEDTTRVAPEPESVPEPEAKVMANAVADPGGTAEPGLDAETGTPDSEPAQPAEPAVLEDKKVLMVGSSMIATGFGALLEKQLDAHPHVQAFRKAKSASGLARPDFFDWMDTARKQIEFREPDLVIVLMGGNDGQDLTVARGSKRVVWQSDGWEDAYRGRVDEFLDALVGPGRTVLWLGPPRTNTVKFEKKLTLLRDIQKAAVEANPGAEFLELSPFLEGGEGELLREARVQGKNQTLRSEDGIHLTMGGSHYLADQVYPEVLKALGMPDVEDLPAK